MKIFTFLLLCSIIIFINALDCYEKQNPSSLSECQILTVSDGNKCCYTSYIVELNGDSQGFSTCSEFTKKQYENIDELKSELKESTEEQGLTVKSFNILCDTTTDTSDDSGFK